MNSTPRDPRRIVLIPVAEIIRDPQYWHVRVDVTDAEVKRLAELLRATGDLDPITVIPTAKGYLLGLGVIRLLAAEYLGESVIPAHLEPEIDTLALLRRQLADDEAITSYSTLERGWALRKLREVSAAAGIPLTQKEICEERNLDKGTVSLILQAAEVIPVERVQKAAAEHGLDWRKVARLPRDAIRAIASRPQPVGDELLHAACRALDQGASPVRAVKAALKKIEGAPPPARKGLRSWAPDLLMKILAWLGAQAARGIAAVLQWSRTPVRPSGRVHGRRNGQSPAAAGRS